MNKNEFLYALKQKLSALDDNEIENWLSYYEEMIDDRVEDGQTENEAVASLGGLNNIAAEILSQASVKKLVKERFNRRTLKAWEIVLLIVGLPLWFPLLIAAVSVALTLYLVIWACVIIFYGANLTLAASGLAVLCVAIVSAAKGNIPAGAFLLGSGLFCVGVSIFMLLALNQLSKGVVWLTKKLFIAFKRSLIVREAV